MVVVCSVKLCLRDRSNAVFIEESCNTCAALLRLGDDSVFVGLRGNVARSFEGGQLPKLVVRQRLVAFLELTVRQTDCLLYTSDAADDSPPV